MQKQWHILFSGLRLISLQVYYKRWAGISHERIWYGWWCHNQGNHIWSWYYYLWSGYRSCKLILYWIAISLYSSSIDNTKMLWFHRMVESTMKNSLQWWRVETNKASYSKAHYLTSLRFWFPRPLLVKRFIYTTEKYFQKLVLLFGMESFCLECLIDR